MQKTILTFALLLSGFFTTLAYSPAVLANTHTHKCGDVEVAINVECPAGSGGSKAISNNPIILYLKAIIKFLSAGVAIVVVMSIVVSGIQYIVSRGDPQILQAAKGRLWNSIIGLLLFIFMFAILNYLIPGGILR